MDSKESPENSNHEKKIEDSQDGLDNTSHNLLSRNNNLNVEEGNMGNRRRKSLKSCSVLMKNNRRKWIAALAVILLIFIVIIISLAVCSGNGDYDDDENKDQSGYDQQQKFNGSFVMPRYPFSDESQVHDDIQKQLADLYHSSHALGRFFSRAEAVRLRNDSTVVQYELTFVYPKEQETELINFTLGREMVYNLFRQFLYDQNEDNSNVMFIDPLSLKMTRGV